MRRTANFPQLFFHVTAAIVLTLITGVLGSPFLRLLRKTQGPIRFWAAGLIVAALFLALGADLLAVLVGSIWMTLGVYSELEQRGRGWWISGLAALMAGTVVQIAGFSVILKRLGITTWERFVALIDEKLMVFLPVEPSMRPEPALFAQQMPSVLVILLMLCLGTALIFERKLFAWTGFPRDRVASHLKLLEFRVPDFYVWIALSGFLLTMVNFGSKTLVALGLNVVNVSVVLYFFQGLAVLEVLLNALKAGAFLRLAVYLILVGQLFFMLSAVGLIDYWVDFRRRLRPGGTGVEKDPKYGGSV